MPDKFVKFSRLALLCLSCVIAINTSAQKLPNKQEGSMRAPSKVKIDGKLTEWGAFKAFNKATEVFYTIANDNDNLYLIIKAEDEGIARKIISKGVLFSVNASGKKSDPNTVSVTYPVFNYKTKPYIKFSDKPASPAGIDSFVLVNNQRFIGQSKFVRVAGITGLDSLISVYNADGIRVASMFDKDMHYTYEMAISLKYIKQMVNSEGKLFYRVTLNAIQMDDMPGLNITRDAAGTITSIVVNKRDALPNSYGVNADTDFLGEYVLAK